jgi:hypothetical protein
VRRLRRYCRGGHRHCHRPRGLPGPATTDQKRKNGSSDGDAGRQGADAPRGSSGGHARRGRRFGPPSRRTATELRSFSPLSSGGGNGRLRLGRCAHAAFVAGRRPRRREIAVAHSSQTPGRNRGAEAFSKERDRRIAAAASIHRESSRTRRQIEQASKVDAEVSRGRRAMACALTSRRLAATELSVIVDPFRSSVSSADILRGGWGRVVACGAVLHLPQREYARMRTRASDEVDGRPSYSLRLGPVSAAAQIRRIYSGLKTRCPPSTRTARPRTTG